MGSLIRQYKCYATNCGKESPIDLTQVIGSKSFTTVCPHCGKKWAVSFTGRSCCHIVCLFVSVEASNKAGLKKTQSFKA